MPQGKRSTRKRPPIGPRAGLSKKKITQTARQVQALNLRISGASFEQIATAMGYRTRSAAYKAVQEALRRTIIEPADEVRQQELARLDRLLLGIWTSATTASPHQLDALDRVLKIMDRRCYYITGLKVPEKVAPTNPEGTQSYQPQIPETPSAQQAFMRDVGGILAMYAHGMDGTSAGLPSLAANGNGVHHPASPEDE